MKLLYGTFSVNYSEALQNISQNQSFVTKLETLAYEDNKCIFQLSELYQKYPQLFSLWMMTDDDTLAG